MLGAVALAWALLFGGHHGHAPVRPAPVVHVCPSWGCHGYPYGFRPIPRLP